MRTLFYAFVFIVFTNCFVSCSKDSITDYPTINEVATEGDDEKDKSEPGAD